MKTKREFRNQCLYDFHDNITLLITTNEIVFRRCTFQLYDVILQGKPIDQIRHAKCERKHSGIWTKKEMKCSMFGYIVSFFPVKHLEIENILLVLQNRNESPRLQEIISKFKLHASGYTCCDPVFKTFTTVSKNLILKVREIAKYFSFSLGWFYLTRQTTSHNLYIK